MEDSKDGLSGTFEIREDKNRGLKSRSIEIIWFKEQWQRLKKNEQKASETCWVPWST